MKSFLTWLACALALLWMSFGLALALFVSDAHAQAERPPCYPTVNGVHVSAPRHFFGEHGQHVFWACSPRGGQARIYGFSCAHGECSMAALHSVHSAILSATAKVTTANTEWDANVKFNCKDVLAEQSPRGRMCRERVVYEKVFGSAP